jgi:1-deoxy-D-xylulose-5-phosphate synthase
MLEPSMKAAHELADLGWSVGVMDPRFVKPLDKDLIIDQVNRTKNVLTVEEGVLAGGFGSAVLELLADEMIQDVRVARLGIPDAFIEHGTRHELLVEVGLTPEAIRDRALQILSPKGETKVTRFSVLRN